MYFLNNFSDNFLIIYINTRLRYEYCVYIFKIEYRNSQYEDPIFTNSQNKSSNFGPSLKCRNQWELFQLSKTMRSIRFCVKFKIARYGYRENASRFRDSGYLAERKVPCSEVKTSGLWISRLNDDLQLKQRSKVKFNSSRILRHGRTVQSPNLINLSRVSNPPKTGFNLAPAKIFKHWIQF